MEPNDQKPAPDQQPTQPPINNDTVADVEFMPPPSVAGAQPEQPAAVPQSETAHTTPAVDPALAEKLEQAKLAMEGPEHAAKREQEEKGRSLESEKKQLALRMEEITKEKEKLEVKWVELDERRTEFKKTLTPILEQEAQVEKEEIAAEEEEGKIGLERERKIIEEKRRLIEDKRRTVENEKWMVEEKIWKIDDTLDANTKQYRALLDEEDEILRRLDDINQELNA